MGLKCPVFLSYTLFLILSTKYPSKITALKTSSDNHHIRCIATERKALLKLKSSFQSSWPNLLKSWGREGGEDDCCKWIGVECSNTTGHVTGLDLSWSYKACTIDASLVELRHLTYLNLSYNDHNNCQIPEFIGHLHKLEEIDLSSSSFGGKIPHQLGNLSLLKFLDLSYNDFNGSSIPESFMFLRNLVYLNFHFSNIGGKVQDQLKNLSRLQFLDLANYGYHAYSNQLEWVSHLYSLRYLTTKGFNLSNAVDWGQSLTNLPRLIEFHIWYSALPALNGASPTMTIINASSSLSIIDLTGNKLTPSIYQWLLNFNSSLIGISLCCNLLQGPIPNDFWNMPFLFYLDMSENELEGGLPSSISKSPSLKYLLLSSAHLKGDLSNSIAHLHKLIYLDLSNNSFYGIISEDHLRNFTSLEHLFLSSNSLTLSLDPNWIPPFQLYSIGLGSCNIGPQFPRWLQTQTSFNFLDLSFNKILGTLPDWFWNLSSKASHLFISNNKIHGEVPSQAFSQNPTMVIDLNSNHFEGSLPLFNPGIVYVDLSKNNFRGTLPSLCNYKKVKVLDLSENHLSGELPRCWKEKSYKHLSILNLSNNNLTGNIHNPLCSSAGPSLEILQLGDNSFNGELPSTLSKCTHLKVLDVASNKISGGIPKWIGNNLRDLRILILRSNRFNGSIPLNLCWLHLVQVMDLSRNNLTGYVLNCLHNSSVMTSGDPPALFAPLLLLIYPTLYFANVTSKAEVLNHRQ